MKAEPAFGSCTKLSKIRAAFYAQDKVLSKYHRLAVLENELNCMGCFRHRLSLDISS